MQQRHRDENSTDTHTLSPDGAGGFVVRAEFGGGRMRIYGGFATEDEARACLERGQGQHGRIALSTELWARLRRGS